MGDEHAPHLSKIPGSWDIMVRGSGAFNLDLLYVKPQFLHKGHPPLSKQQKNNAVCCCFLLCCCCCLCCFSCCGCGCLYSRRCPIFGGVLRGVAEKWVQYWGTCLQISSRVNGGRAQRLPPARIIINECRIGLLGSSLPSA